MNRIYQFGIAIIQWLQTFSPGLDGVMGAATFLGRIEFFILFIPLLYWCVDQVLALRVLFALIATDALGAYAKQLFHQPRPYWIGGVEQLSTEGSYGIPSTHASDTLAVWGLIAVRVRKTWMWFFTALLLLLIGLSRLYLGVHFPQDLLGGWLLGLIVLLLFLKYEGRFLTWWKQKAARAQILLGFVSSAALMLVGLLVVWLVSGLTDPAAWAAFATEGRDVSHYVTLGGFLFGAVVGLVWMQQFARFQMDGSILQRVTRYALGMIGLFAIYLGLDALFAALAPDVSLAGYFLRYIRYACVSLWATFGAPWVFLMTGLAKRQ
jgi:membrane-associated phospholipid phosphatase